MSDLAVNIHIAHGDPRSGYGKFEAGLWRALEQAGVNVTPLGIWTAGLSQIMAMQRGTDEWKKITQIAPVTIVMARPHEALWWHVRQTRAWLYTMAETDRVDEFWVGMINKHFERVLVPCPQLVDVYRDSGVRIPVHYLVSGADFTVPKVADRRIPGQRIFMTYSLGADTRKGAQIALQAFKVAFGNRGDCQLWIKCVQPGQSWIAGCQDHQVRILTGAMSEMEWFSWLSHANFFLFPSRGEGFGLPPREATLAGVPTVATPWLGMWDVCEWGYPTQIDKLRPHDFVQGTVNAPGALWADSDMLALSEQLQWLDTHEDDARQKAQQGREYLLNNFTWKHSAEALIKLLEEHGQ